MKIRVKVKRQPYSCTNTSTQVHDNCFCDIKDISGLLTSLFKKIGLRNLSVLLISLIPILLSIGTPRFGFVAFVLLASPLLLTLQKLDEEPDIAEATHQLVREYRLSPNPKAFRKNWVMPLFFA